MLRALLIWLCFTEILKKTGSSSRSAWSPWHFSENLDQLGTWYIYIYILGINSKHIRKLPSVEIGSKKWSNRINPAVVKWTWWFATHPDPHLHFWRQWCIFFQEWAMFFFHHGLNQHILLVTCNMYIRWSQFRFYLPPPRSRAHPGAREQRFLGNGEKFIF